MDFTRKVAMALAIFLAVVMLCGGIGFLSYTYGYRTGHEIGYARDSVKTSIAGDQPGYSSNYLPETQPGPNMAVPNEVTFRNPTYQEAKAFLAQDPTSLNSYRDENYVCVDFAAAVTNNAEARGIRCGTVDIFYPQGYGHTIVAFQTTDRGLVFFEPQFDQEVRLIAGRSYAAINSFTKAPRDDTIKRFVIIW